MLRNKRRTSRKFASRPRPTELHNFFQTGSVLLQLGGNDICYSSARPDKVACSIAELVEMLGKFESVQVGVVCELFKRLRPRNIRPQLYEERRKIIKNMLPLLLGDLTHKKILFLRHLRLMNNPLHVLGSDGVHLSAVGNKKCYSIRLAIMHALDFIVWIACH